MKLTKETLKQIIKEELEAVMSEALGGKQGLIKLIMDVNADETSKQEAIGLINQLVADDEGNKYAEDLAQELSQSVPEEWLSSWINYAQSRRHGSHRFVLISQKKRTIKEEKPDAQTLLSSKENKNGLKEELTEKLAGIDCKDKIKETLDSRKDDIKKALYLDERQRGGN